MQRHNDELIHLDGDILRGTLCSDLGFSDDDRRENLRRAASVAEILNCQGKDVVASFITPFSSSLTMIKGIIENLKIVYVNTPLDVCRERDVKGMYAKAAAGEIKGFTGVDSRFDEPFVYDVKIPTHVLTLNECIGILLRSL